MKKIDVYIEDRHYEIHGDKIYAYHSKLPIGDLLYLVQQYNDRIGPITRVENAEWHVRTT